MVCPNCKSDLSLEELKKHLTDDDIKRLWASVNGKKMTEARRQANIDRANNRWAKVRGEGAPGASE